MAREIHRLSGRDPKGDFIAINCSAIPHELLESEIFGHEKGAFSGAVSSYQGRMRLADGGSLLLDEIGDMPPDLQAKLLRVVQEGVVTPVGSGKEIPVDVRIISATHKPLEALIEKGLFREDLFFRLNVIPITVSPLRDRPEEVVELFDHFSVAYALQETPLSRMRAPSACFRHTSGPAIFANWKTSVGGCLPCIPAKILIFTNCPQISFPPR